MRTRARALAALAAIAIAGADGGQVAAQETGEHAAHHPAPAGAPAPPAAQANAQSGMSMSGMMSGMGEDEDEHDGGRQPIYPSLAGANLHDPATRLRFTAEADQRLHSGMALISEGSRAAAGAGSPEKMKEAAEQVREGLSLFESGAAVKRALASGADGAAIANDWFRNEMSLGPEGKRSDPSQFGMSAMHIAVMALLVAVALALAALQFARLRRARALVAGQSLRTPASTAKPTAAEAPAGRSSVLPAAPSPGGAPIAPAAPAGRRWSGELRVAQIVGETPTVETFRLVPLEGDRLPFDYLPGQFLQVEVEPEPGKPVRRSYTIASSPTQRGYVEITVKREEKGIVSCYLHDNVKVGDTIRAAGAFGAFTFTGTDAESIVLIAGGVGITPMMSVLRYLTDTAWSGEIFFLYGARSTEEFVFREEIERLERRHPKLHVLAAMQRTPGTVWLGPEGMLTKELIQAAVPEIARRRIHLCGPPPMMAGVKAFLRELGVPEAQIHSEAFGPASLPHEHAPEAVTTAPEDIATAPPPAAAAAPEGKSEEKRTPEVAPTTVSFSISGVSAPLREGETILEAAEIAGVEIPFSCRVGECGVCVTKLLQGEVSMGVETGLDPADKAQGYVLACQAKSTGSPLVVEA